MKRLTSIGDTIIEVLIAMAIVSLVLGGAYISANESFNDTRQAQERSEALQIIESQLEALKQLASNGNTTIFTSPYVFCINNSYAATNATNTPSTSTPTLTFSNSSTFAPACSNLGTAQIYNISIQQTATDQFTATAQWYRAGGGGTGVDQLQIVDRIYTG